MKIDKANSQQNQMDCSCVRKMLQFGLPGQWSRLVIGDEEPPMAPTRGLEAADNVQTVSDETVEGLQL